jgi:hypothetical protein
VCKYTIPSTGTGVAFTNSGVAITTLDAGRYLVQFAYAVQPITAGANISGVSYAVTTVAVLGGAGAVGVLQHIVSASSGANAINKCSNCGIFTVSADNTPIYISLTATVSAGNYQSAVSTLDTATGSQVAFVKID